MPRFLAPVALVQQADKPACVREPSRDFNINCTAANCRARY